MPPPPGSQHVTIQVVYVVAPGGGTGVTRFSATATPPTTRLKSPKNEPAGVAAGDTVVRWVLKVARLADGGAVQNAKFEIKNGIIMNKNPIHGPVWEDSWGIPNRLTPHTFELRVLAASDPGTDAFKYSVLIGIPWGLGGGTATLSLDPEVEFDL
jgi:hypothetical protein